MLSLWTAVTRSGSTAALRPLLRRLPVRRRRGIMRRRCRRRPAIRLRFEVTGEFDNGQLGGLSRRGRRGGARSPGRPAVPGGPDWRAHALCHSSDARGGRDARAVLHRYLCHQGLAVGAAGDSPPLPTGRSAPSAGANSHGRSRQERSVRFTAFGWAYVRRPGGRSQSGRTDQLNAYLWAGKRFCDLVLREGLEGVTGVYTFNKLQAWSCAARCARSQGIQAVSWSRRLPHAGMLEGLYWPKNKTVSRTGRRRVAGNASIEGILCA